MELSVWFLYVTIATLNIVSPGPAILLAVANSLSYGIRFVTFSSLGNIMGLLVLASSATVGLATLFKTYPLAFTVLKFIGAGYLIFLGIRQLRSKQNIFNTLTIDKISKHTSPRRLFMQGFFLAVTNPKPILFFAALYPQFIDGERPLLPQFVIMTITFMTISFIALMAYAYLSLVQELFL